MPLFISTTVSIYFALLAQYNSHENGRVKHQNAWKSYISIAYVLQPRRETMNSNVHF